MRATTFLWAGAASAALLVGPSGAVAQNSGATPAERPPEQFSGLQYVDSAGCVFIRAGRDDVVTWVPRATRAGQPLCGFAPTLSADATRSLRAASMTPTQQAPAGMARSQSVQATSVTSVAAPRSGVTPIARAVPAVTVAPTIATTPAVPGPCDVSLASARSLVGCAEPGVDATSDFATLMIPPQTRNSTHGSEEIGVATVRARPGVAASAPRIAPPGSATYSFDPSGRRGTIVAGPPATITRLTLATQRIAVPKGYKEAWEDGRLNVFRGLGTAKGTAQMRRSWTETVPQQLVPALR